MHRSNEREGGCLGRHVGTAYLLLDTETQMHWIGTSDSESWNGSQTWPSGATVRLQAEWHNAISWLHPFLTKPLLMAMRSNALEWKGGGYRNTGFIAIELVSVLYTLETGRRVVGGLQSHFPPG
jgi:hypothetical protein